MHSKRISELEVAELDDIGIRYIGHDAVRGTTK